MRSMTSYGILFIVILFIGLCGCSDDDCPTCPDQQVEPNVIDDVTTGLPNYNSVVISWTAPDSALEYDIRYSTSMIDSSNWSAATPVDGEPAPQEKGELEIYRLTGLADATEYYIAIKFRTDATTWSDLSNIATCYTSLFDSRGKIVFSAFVDDDTESEIFMCDSDGSNMQRLTYDLNTEYYVNFTNDGNYLIYEMLLGGSLHQIYMMDIVADTAGVIYDNPEGDYFVRCAYNEPIMVFSGDGMAGQDRNIYTMNYGGGSRVRLTDYVDSMAVWPDISADGGKIVYSCIYNLDSWTYTMDANGANLTKIKDIAVNSPAWSPDGTQIAYSAVGTSDIHVMNADGTGDINLTNSAYNDNDPRWSPDGTQILFCSDRDGDYEIYVMDADGTDVTQLTFNDYTDEKPNWSPVQ